MISRLFIYLLICISVCSVCASSKSRRKAELELLRNIELFESKIEGFDDLDRSGHFLENDFERAEDALAGKGNVGVVIEVDNYSQFLLDDQRHHVKYGWQDKHLSKKRAIRPKNRDIVLFHNYADGGARSSGGSISWQVKKEDGSPYILAGKKRKGLRIVLTWSIWYKQCGRGVKNEVTVHFIHNFINEDGNWKKPSENLFYENKHKNPSNIAWKREAPYMEIKASIEDGCTPKLLIQFHSTGSKPNTFSPFELPVGSPGAEFSMTWILIYVGIGMAIIILLLFITRAILQKTKSKKEYKPVKPNVVKFTESDTDNE